MGKSDGNNDTISNLLITLREFGPIPIVIMVIGVVFVMRLHKIIPAASAAWKQHKETDQRLTFKRIEFERKLRTAIAAKAPPDRPNRKQGKP